MAQGIFGETVGASETATGGMTHVDLFSGIGGFALAAQWAGFKTVAFVEIEPYAQELIKQNFGAVADADDAGRRELSGCKSVRAQQSAAQCCRLFSDIRAFDGTAYRGATLLTGGFPCQPFSQAGKRRGKEDDRYLWPEMLRVISEARPAWVLGENVAGIVTMELDRVLSDLEGEGYAVQPLVIPACAVDAKHRRDRVWIVAHAAERGRERRPSEQRRRNFEQGQDRARQASSVVGVASEDVADAARDEQRRQEQWPIGERARQCGESLAVERRTIRESCWLPEPDVGRVVDGLSLELDFARQITAYVEQKHFKKAHAKRNELVGKLLRAVWEHREIATASPDLYVERLRDSVPEVPLRNSQSRWLLGPRIETDEGLRDLWTAFYSKSQQEAQDMQFKLLERAWSAKRGKTLGNRINRLKGLGNAIVPQVAFEIVREIARLENENKD